MNQIYKKVIVLSLLAVFAPLLFALAQELPGTPPSPSISSVDNSANDVGIVASGTATPNSQVWLSLKNQAETFEYLIKAKAGANGKWSANFDQPLKKGEYYLQAIEIGPNGILSQPAMSGKVNVRGAFANTIAIFSYLVGFLTVVFVVGWYVSKWAEKKRAGRILMSERDVSAVYNIIKKDVQKARQNMELPKLDESQASETKFLLERISENLEKINTYIIKGIKVIEKYNLIGK